MPTEKQTYTKEEIEKIIEESVNIVKNATEHAIEESGLRDNPIVGSSVEATTAIVIAGMKKTLKTKFGIKEEKTYKRKTPVFVTKIESKEDMANAISDILDVIFGD